MSAGSVPASKAGGDNQDAPVRVLDSRGMRPGGSRARAPARSPVDGPAVLRSRRQARRHLGRGVSRESLRRTRPARASVPPPCLALVRLVHARRRAGDRHPPLSGAPAADEARALADARGRGRQSPGVPAHPAPRVRARHPARLPARSPRRVAPALRQPDSQVPRGLPAQPREPALRAAPAALLRQEPSGRGLRRDVRRLAAAAQRVAAALCGMASAQEVGVRRPPDERARRRGAAGAEPSSAGTAGPAHHDPRPVLRREARAVFAQLSRPVRS